MPSLFDKNPKAGPGEQTPGLVTITNSELWCQECPTDTDTGLYNPEKKTLTFTCPRGHENVVRGIEIE